jgi:hypothetical protein
MRGLPMPKAIPSLLLILALLTGCAQPLPAARADCAGEWRCKGVLLLITADGRVVHERKADSSSVRLNAPIKRFDGESISA